MYHHGRGVARDYNEALRWYLLAADKGSVAAMTALGTPPFRSVSALCPLRACAGSIYRDGEVAQKDLALAAKYFRMAADKGNAAAQINLGTPLARAPLDICLTPILQDRCTHQVDRVLIRTQVRQ